MNGACLGPKSITGVNDGGVVVLFVNVPKVGRVYQ